MPGIIPPPVASYSPRFTLYALVTFSPITKPIRRNNAAILVIDTPTRRPGSLSLLEVSRPYSRQKKKMNISAMPPLYIASIIPYNAPMRVI